MLKGAQSWQRSRGTNIDGEFVATGKVLEKRNPTDGTLVAKVHEAGKNEVDRSYVGRVERGDNNVASLSIQCISSACATEQRLAERRAASGARLKPDVNMA